MSVDFNDANKAWAEKMGIIYPLLSDTRRVMSRAYGVLYDDPQMADDPKTIPIYLRNKRVWIVVDKAGAVQYIKVAGQGEVLPPTEEILKVISELK